MTSPVVPGTVDFAGVEGQDDVRMVQRGQRLHLAAEALQKDGTGLGLGHHHLDGDRPLHVNVFGLVDDAHAAGAEPVDDTVVAEDQSEDLTGEDAANLILVEQAARHERVDQVGGIVVAQPRPFLEEAVQLLGVEQTAVPERFQEFPQRRITADGEFHSGCGLTRSPKSGSFHGLHLFPGNKFAAAGRVSSPSPDARMIYVAVAVQR